MKTNRAWKIANRKYLSCKKRNYKDFAMNGWSKIFIYLKSSFTSKGKQTYNGKITQVIFLAFDKNLALFFMAV